MSHTTHWLVRSTHTNLLPKIFCSAWMSHHCHLRCWETAFAWRQMVTYQENIHAGCFTYLNEQPIVLFFWWGQLQVPMIWVQLENVFILHLCQMCQYEHLDYHCSICVEPQPRWVNVQLIFVTAMSIYSRTQTQLWCFYTLFEAALSEVLRVAFKTARRKRNKIL